MYAATVPDELDAVVAPLMICTPLTVMPLTTALLLPETLIVVVGVAVAAVLHSL